MTTFEKISTDPAANRTFWSAMAASQLYCYRDHKEGMPLQASFERQAFRDAMSHRRNQTYFRSPS